MKLIDNSLDLEHLNHLLAEGFTSEQISNFVSNNLIRSLTPEEAYKAGYSVTVEKIPVTGGLLFQFSPTFGQLRLDNPNIIPKDRCESDSKYAKYLSLGGAINLECAYLPEGCQSVTEGMKDALAFTHIGGVPTGAVAGVSHVTKALPKGCGYTVVFDYDALENFEVFKNLIRAGVHCGGKVAIVPEIEGEPKAGGCEYFKAGFTAEDYQQLLDNAQTPLELFREWFDLQQVNDEVTASLLGVKASKLIGELFGYATTTTKTSIKSLIKTDKLVEWNLPLADVLRDSGNTQAGKKGGDNDDENIDPRTAVNLAIDIVKTRAVLFHSKLPDSISYASIPSKTGVVTTHQLDSSEFKSWVVEQYYRETDDGLTGEQMQSIMATVKAIAAHDAPELPVSEKRVVELDNRYYLYLADESQTVVEYSSVGWSVCENCPVKFIFDKYKAALPIPIRTGSIEPLWDIVRITEPSDRLAVAAILVKALVPGGGEPILALSGYAGSGKTTSAKYLGLLLDPFSKGGVLAKIPDLDTIAIHGKKRIFIKVDNLDNLTKGESNLLAGVSTGTGATKRKNYTDTDEIVMDVQNIVILTSIGNVVNKSDLLSRAVNIELTRLTDEDRTSESTIQGDFDRHHGGMLGGLLNMTVAALNYRDTTESPKYNRMTNFIHLGDGVEQHLAYEGVTLCRRLKLGEIESNTITIESSPTASILIDWIKDLNEWEGLTSVLLNNLKSHAKKTDQSGVLPNNAIKLSSELRMIESALLEQGIEIISKRHKAGMYISISCKKVKDDLSTLSTPEEEDKPREDSGGVDRGVDRKKLSTPEDILSTPEPDGVDRHPKGVDRKKLSTPLSTPLEPLPDADIGDGVDSVDNNDTNPLPGTGDIPKTTRRHMDGDV